MFYKKRGAGMISKGENSFHECKLYDSLPSRDINPTAPAPRRKLKLMNKKSLCQGDRDPGTCHPALVHSRELRRLKASRARGAGSFERTPWGSAGGPS